MLMLLIIYNNGETTGPVLLCDHENKVVAATEENEVMLLALGDGLLEENVISAYQLIKSAGMPVTKIIAGFEESE